MRAHTPVMYSAVPPLHRGFRLSRFFFFFIIIIIIIAPGRECDGGRCAVDGRMLMGNERETRTSDGQDARHGARIVNSEKNKKTNPFFPIFKAKRP